MNPTRTASTQGQLTPTTPSPQDSLARIADSLTELVRVQRETMASINGLWEMAEQSSEIQRVSWLDDNGFEPIRGELRLLAKRLGWKPIPGVNVPAKPLPSPNQSSSDSRPT